MAGADPLNTATELHPALLQAAITLGITALCAVLYQRYHKPYFFWWAVAWTLYCCRLVAIVIYLLGRDATWLFVHQVITGWTAIAFLWSALVFSRGVRFRPVYLLVVLFPPVWSLFAIYEFTERDQFLFAALPAVAFLSGATLWTAGVFFRFRRQSGSRGAMLLGIAFLLWGFHHLDYPIFRAKGAWNPWGYYLDIIFTLAVGAGILLLVLEDIERGLGAMAALSGDLQRGDGAADVPGALLRRALVLPGVRGSALFDRQRGLVVRGLGASAAWEGAAPPGRLSGLVREVLTTGRPRSSSGGEFAYAAALPVVQGTEVRGAMLIVGDARDPFTALDESFLNALGHQVGAALENADLDRRLRRRTEELEWLSGRMVAQHEEERRRLSLELHDETAQVFSAVKLQLGIVREEVPAAEAARLGRVLELVDEGMASIRRVTEALRPSLLDDLGLLPAVRALVTDFETRTGIVASFEGPAALPALPEAAELAVFRGVQEALSNVARHAEASQVSVEVTATDESLGIVIVDDGRGYSPADGSAEERMGLAGMRERFAALGGRVTIARETAGGTRLRLELPDLGGTS
ncbi:MAG TPA: ATP-binding protein [Gemmatimonadales bacterium]|nr:ATP-binding protein [Gemmatimonadales bacterium]